MKTLLRCILACACSAPLFAFQPPYFTTIRHSSAPSHLSLFRPHVPSSSSFVSKTPIRSQIFASRSFSKRSHKWSCQAPENADGGFPQQELAAKGLVWSAWAAYMFHIFFSDSPCGPAGGEMCGISLPVTMEAINLSINFWFITPLVFPSLAPVVHPALEGLFNIVIAWGALFVGFLHDGKGQRVPMFPFMIGTAFLTNVFYLPYLGLRSSSTDPDAIQSEPAKALEIAESKWWPLAMTAVVAASVLWGSFARGAEFGDVSTRAAALVDMATHTDRLAHSFMVDSSVFWLFQGWLVPDDMKRRNFEDQTTALVARIVPFLGLVYYLLVRPPLPESEQP